nr:MotA/TolQ/ExbB proton channel [uncultured Gammaproteobacteria bacterium]
MLLLAVSGLAFGGSTAPAPEGDPKPTASEIESLAAAYQREYAFLDSQRRQLEKLLEDFRRNAAAQEAQLTAKIAALQRQVLDLSQQAKRQEEAIAEAEKRREAAQENAALLETTLTQAKATLEDYGTPSDAQTIAQLWPLALETLQRGSTPHRQPGAFFLADGREASGEILFLGHVAAYGISDQGAGILLPAGEGRLKLLPNPQASEAAKALAAGQQPPTLPVFLFESLKHPVELEQRKTWRQELDDGGPIAWVIAGLGVLGLALALLRAAILLAAGWGGQRLAQRIVDAVAAGARQAAQDRLERAKGAYSEVLKASLSHLELPQEEWEIAVADALLQQSLRLDRFASLILVVAAVAPLLGLLGTVTGMIETFDVITRFGTGDPKLLAHGIAVALITTEVGLVVAIPLLLLGNLLNAWAGSLKADLELCALAVREAGQTRGQSELPKAPQVLHAQPMTA